MKLPTKNTNFSRTKVLLILWLSLVLNNLEQATAFSASPGGDSKSPLPKYETKSTSRPDEENPFAEGSESRRERLDIALSQFGIDPVTLTGSAEFRGSAALRAYNSFVLPKSAGALAVTESPQRAAVVANNISFLIREHKSHQEEWLRNHDRSIAEADEILRGAPRQPLTLVLDNVRSAHNVGNILRCAEAAGISKVVLCGITPGPPNPKVLKTAVGSAEYVPHAHSGSTLEAVRELQRQGVKVWGVETTSKSQPMWKTEMPQPLALVFGNEIAGVDADVLKECDGLVCIPTHGVKNSLNVATCASVVMWEALRQWDQDLV